MYGLLLHVHVFQNVMQGDITGYQVYYNGTMMNVSSSTNTLIFTAPSLPNGVFTDTIVVMVTAVSKYGVGPASETDAAVVNGKQICNTVCGKYLEG